jgi:hypothetical protein
MPHFEKMNFIIELIVLCLQKLLRRTILDPMHIERNILANLLNHLMGEKDTLAMRRDMEEVAVASPHPGFVKLHQTEGTLRLHEYKERRVCESGSQHADAYRFQCHFV